MEFLPRIFHFLQLFFNHMKKKKKEKELLIVMKGENDETGEYLLDFNSIIEIKYTC